MFLWAICFNGAIGFPLERSEWVCGASLMWAPHAASDAAALGLVTPEFAPRTLKSSVHYGN